MEEKEVTWVGARGSESCICHVISDTFKMAKMNKILVGLLSLICVVLVNCDKVPVLIWNDQMYVTSFIFK